uniref:Uncharacterized protein n=1 Tax=Alexandrium monilatum TaxID=311494 RepID=A0A7S4S6C0_9DINO
MPPKKSELPPRKRLAATGTQEASTHYEVFQIVKRRKIHLAEELFSLAQERSAGGDHSLLLYCSGEEGMSKRLQAIVDSAWTPDPGIAEGSSSGSSSLARKHAAPLTPTRLQELRAFARGPPLPTQVVPLKVTKSPARKKFFLAQLAEMRPARGDEVTLFDSFGMRAEVVFRPRCGMWRLRDFYEVLATARRDEVLAGIAPCAAPEGGFRLRRTEAGWRAMLRAGAASPRVPFAELSDAQREAAAAEVRLGVGCGALSWRPPEADSADGKRAADVWIDAMPEDPRFETDTLAAFAHEERLVRVWASRHVEDRQLLALVHAFEACHHAVHQTQGFKLDRGNMRITSSKFSMCRHKSNSKLSYGALAAHACEEEALESSAGRRGSLLAIIGGSHRSASQRPARLPSRLQALSNTAASSPAALPSAPEPKVEG